MKDERPLEGLPDDELLRRLIELTQRSRRVEADLVAHIAEVDKRRLYAREASQSMFAYCTDVLHLSEAEAYLRIAVARASREYPILLVMLSDGRLHLTGLAKLAPHLTRENAAAILERATHRSKRQVEEMVAELAPRPDAPAVMRRLPARRPNPAASVAPAPVREAAVTSLAVRQCRASTVDPGARQAAVHPLELRPDAVASSPAAAPVFPALRTDVQPVFPVLPTVVPPPSPARPTVVEPLAPARYKVQFTASAELHDKLERLRGLMRSQIPSGDLAEIIDRAVTETLERLEVRRFARSSKPRKALGQTSTTPASRHVPGAVKRVVQERDAGRCRYVDEAGRRCPERTRLEYHHRLPFGMGGDHRPTNVALLCRTHNQYLADNDYGRQVMANHRANTHAKGRERMRVSADQAHGFDGCRGRLTAAGT